MWVAITIVLIVGALCVGVWYVHDTWKRAEDNDEAMQ